ncbi:MAG TPA: hypothetical protein VJ826_01330, partial [Candidatus Polarisedimenticolaceae bacterium]|nr:hypothetical protein [Candidatus Polarisedimenticolaceae bacterium]
MIWRAAELELFTLALAVLVLLCDLVVPRQRADARRAALFVLSGIGLVAILAASLRSVPGISLGAAYVQDAFALLVKRVMLASVLMTVVGLAPHARRRRASDRSGEAIVLLLFAAVGGMALVSAREWITLFVAFELLSL